MRDLPTGLDLMALARRLLLEEILPLVPEERRPDLRLAATSMAIAAREAANGDGPLCEIRDLLAEFYAEAAPHPGPLPASGEREGSARREGDGGDEGLAGLLSRLSGDLRRGEIQTSGSRERPVRAILWRLTVLKLREGNPQFLAAHGVAQTDLSG
jgi:hypothetical protein